MYTVKQFEIAKPANVVYSNFRLKDHNVLYALGYTFKAGKVGKNSIFWNDKGEAFSRDMTMKFQSIKLKSLNMTPSNLLSSRHEMTLFFGCLLLDRRILL